LKINIWRDFVSDKKLQTESKKAGNAKDDERKQRGEVDRIMFPVKPAKAELPVVARNHNHPSPQSTH
jgi:hypothetical protein